MAVKKEVTIDINGNAAQSLTDIGRVAQDLPFGFTAIQNNIGPLVESFGRSTANAGGVVGALKGLGSALIGPAGIGLTISLVTSAITFLTQSFNPWGKIFGTAGEDTKKAKEELKKFNDELNKTIATADTTGTKLKTYISVAQDVTKSEKERTIAIKEANKIMGEYGEKITLANVSTKAITDQTNSYVLALKQQAITQTYVSRLTQQYTKEQEANVKILEVEERIKIRNQQRDKDIAASNGNQRSIAIITAKAESDINSLRVERNKLVGDYNKLSREGDAIEKEYSKTVEKTLNLQSKTGFNEDKNKKPKSTKEKFDLAGFLTDDEFTTASKTAETQYERLRSNEDKRYSNQLEKLQKALNDKQITQSQFDQASIQLENNHTQIVASLKEDDEKIKQNKTREFQKEIDKIRLDTALAGAKDNIEKERIQNNESYRILLENAKVKYGENSSEYFEYKKVLDEEYQQKELNLQTEFLNKKYNEQLNRGKINTSTALSGLNEIFNNEKLSYDERINLLKDFTQKSLNDINLTAEQRKQIETKSAEDLIKIEQAKIKAKQEALNEIKGQLNTLGGLFDESTAVAKGAALASIAIDTAQAIGSLTKHSEANPANSVTFGAAGVLQFTAGILRIATNIAKATKLLSTVKGGGSSTSVPTGGNTSSLSPTITSASQLSPQTQLALSVANSQREPVKAYVVSNEMTTQQALDRSIKNNATFG